jgi:hypothetical protein
MKRKAKKKLDHINFLGFCLLFILIAFAISKVDNLIRNHLSFKVEPEEITTPKLDYIPQFVLISFDGSKSVDMWRKIHEYKEEMISLHKPIQFTHFINAAYFLTDDTKELYKGPGKVPGQSNIGFSDNVSSLKERILEVNRAKESGDEIASHTVGHFSGRYWTEEEWNEEMDSFNVILFNLEKIHANKDLPILNLTKNDIVGFRAPFLDKSSGLYDALHKQKFTYDTSEIGTNNLEWPYKDKDNLWHIPMGIIDINFSKVLAMDYNIWMYDSGETIILQKGTREWQRAYDNTLNAFLKYFDENYTSGRAPVLVGYHFEEWNDGVYWEALKEFGRQVCGRPEVKCGTFKELVEYMEIYGVPKNQ